MPRERFEEGDRVICVRILPCDFTKIQDLRDVQYEGYLEKFLHVSGVIVRITRNGNFALYGISDGSDIPYFHEEELDFI